MKIAKIIAGMLLAVFVYSGTAYAADYNITISGKVSYDVVPPAGFSSEVCWSDEYTQASQCVPVGGDGNYTITVPIYGVYTRGGVHVQGGIGAFHFVTQGIEYYPLPTTDVSLDIKPKLSYMVINTQGELMQPLANTHLQFSTWSYATGSCATVSVVTATPGVRCGITPPSLVDDVYTDASATVQVLTMAGITEDILATPYKNPNILGDNVMPILSGYGSSPANYQPTRIITLPFMSGTSQPSARTVTSNRQIGFSWQPLAQAQINPYFVDHYEIYAPTQLPDQTTNFYGNLLATTQATSYFEPTLKNDGVYAYSVLARDVSGNVVYAYTGHWWFEIDTVAPVMESLTLDKATITRRTVSTRVCGGYNEAGAGMLDTNVMLEYYVDSDPGLEGGIKFNMADVLNVRDPGCDINFNITNLNQYSLGTHTLYVRIQDEAGNWSNLYSVQFLVK